jgi:hypothetical protein
MGELGTALKLLSTQAAAGGAGASQAASQGASSGVITAEGQAAQIGGGGVGDAGSAEFDAEAPPLPSPYSGAVQAPQMFAPDMSQAQAPQMGIPGAGSGQWEMAMAPELDASMPPEEHDEPAPPPAQKSENTPQVTAEQGWDDWQGTVEKREAEEPVNVRGFKPGHRNIIGKALDALFMMTGNKPLYEYNMQERDYRRAMQGYSQNPENAARQATTVSGPEGAKVFDYVQDRKNKDRERIGKAEGPLRQMYYAATPETYEAMAAQAAKYAKAQGIPEDMLPANLDEAKAYAEGGYEIKDRMEQRSKDLYRDRMAGSSEERTDYYGERIRSQNSTDQARIGIYGKDVDSKIADREADNGREGQEAGVMGEAPEGTIQTNRKTGKQRVMRDGKWISL